MGWASPTRLTSSTRARSGGLAVLDRQSVVAVYADDEHGVVVHRSSDAGSTWLPPQTLDEGQFWHTIVSNWVRDVHVTWLRQGRLRYARSTDGGVSFERARWLTSGARWVHYWSLASGGGGLVAVAWQELRRLQVQVSTDRGRTFGREVEFGRGERFVAPHLAIGDGVIYLAHTDIARAGELFVERSTDNGKRWATVLTTRSPGAMSLAADGREAYLFFSGPGYKLACLRTVDAGETWAHVSDAPPAFVSNLRESTLHLAYPRCLDSTCSSSELYASASSAAGWVTKEVPPVLPGRVTPTGIAAVGEANTRAILADLYKWPVGTDIYFYIETS
jgi:hypothetical protein